MQQQGNEKKNQNPVFIRSRFKRENLMKIVE